MMDLDRVVEIMNDVPDYEVFLTVDELGASARQLAQRYPEQVAILPIGQSRLGDTIAALRMGAGPKTALLFAMPHPNEPIGGMMLAYLSERLAEDRALREELGYTWYLITCVDPDGTRLNEGWFKGPFSVSNYARHYYRPPAHQQVEWTFPIDYKTLHFDDPLPETQALMRLIEEVRPDVIYSLHNSGFGGVYFYLSEPAQGLYAPFHALVRSQGLPLHLGEPEMPYAVTFTDAVFKVPFVTEGYDYLEAHTGGDPAEVITGGTASFDYARQFGDPFCLVCEMPYFYHPAIHDTSPSETTRRETILRAVALGRDELAFLQAQYDALAEELTVPSPFRDTLETTLRVYPRHLDAEENWARTDPETERTATVAEEFDSLVIGHFYRLLSLGMFLRMIDAQVAAGGWSPTLSAVREAVEAAFEERSEALEDSLAYTVIPIQKLVRVQLGSALLTAAHAAGRNVG